MPFRSHRPTAAVHPGHCRRRLCPRLCLLLGLFPCLGTILLQRLRKRLVDPLQGSLRVDEEVGRPDAQEAPTETLEDRLPHPIAIARRRRRVVGRSEEHTSELQSLMRISYAVFCLKKKNK